MRNVHARRIAAPASRAGLLLDAVASADDRLWPRQGWPALRLDRGLVVGSAGGHGPIRYHVSDYQPGRSLEFTFEPTMGIDGTHSLLVEAPEPGVTILRHVIAGRLRGRMRWVWPLAIRWLHDALIEDLLDNAERELTGAVTRPARWSPWVRLLRRWLGRRPAGRAAAPATGGGRAV